MDLLEENKKKPKKSKAQKIVLTLLIISIVACIVIGILIAYLSMQGQSKLYTISINGKTLKSEDLQIISYENGEKFISLKSLSNNIGYVYYNGEFKIAGEDKTKGYIDNKTNIVQFFINSNKIYKTTEESKTDKEYYNLDNPIIDINETLYINLNDIDIALNLIIYYSEKDNQTVIQTPEYWIEQQVEKFKSNNITISNTPENVRALSYGYVIASKDDKYGVISLNGEEIIGYKYNKISFSEYSKTFLASNTNNMFGVITENGVAEISLQYDSIEIINYNPLLYKVKKLDKFGFLDENGTVINDIIYDSIGYPENISKGIDYTLIIPNLNENIPESIIVCSNNKYGLIELDSGREVLSCSLNGIYSATQDEKVYYIVETENDKMFLEDYVKNLNSLTVKLD